MQCSFDVSPAPRLSRQQAQTARVDAYNRSVFINCPYHPRYRIILRAIVFAVFACNLRPRCALEASNGGVIRFEKIVTLVKDCRWGIHDLSDIRDEPSDVPHFNMPLEFGLFFGAHRFGGAHQRRKSCLLIVGDAAAFRSSCSNLAGVDVTAHRNRPHEAIIAVRDWVRTEMGDAAKDIAYAHEMTARFDRCQESLGELCHDIGQAPDSLTFTDYCDFVSLWLIGNNRVRAARTTPTTKP